MGSPTYTALATITLTGTDSEVVFASIPSGYRDLILVSNLLNGSGQIECNLIFNNVSSNLPWVRMIGYSGGALSSTASNPYPLVSSNVSQNTVLQIFDYSATDKHKTFLFRRDSASDSRTDAVAGRWASTDAINSIKLSPYSGSFAAGFIASLYGIAG